MLTTHRLSHLRNFQPLFSALEINLQPSEILHLIGPNGSGKSTLLHILAGLILPYEGEVHWEGVSIHDKASHYHAHMLYIGHKIGIKPNLTVLENLQIAARLSTVDTEKDWGVVLQYFKIADLKNTPCCRLSAGQKQRVALTRLLLSKAMLWILDEPFTSLDSETSTALQALLALHSQQGKMAVLTSHHTLNWEGNSLKQLVLPQSGAM